MVEPTFENKDALGGMEIYPGGRGAVDLSDDAVRKIEDGLRAHEVLKTPTANIPDILSTQLDPEQLEQMQKADRQFGSALSARIIPVADNGLDEFSPAVENSDQNTRPNSDDGLGEFSAQTPRPTDLKPETVQGSIERNVRDVELEDLALQAFYDGDNDLSIKYFSEMQDRDSAYEHLETLIGQIVVSRDYDEALRFANLITDEHKKEMEVKYIETQRAKYAPTSTGELEEDDRTALEAEFGSKDEDVGRKVNIKIVKPEIPPLPDIDVEYRVEGEEKKEEPVLLPIEVKENVVPPEVPPALTASIPDAPKGPVSIERNEDVEANFEALKNARDAYSTAFTEWEYKKNNSTKLWEKTMFSLGATKPAPERLTLRTTELEDAREAYLKAREICGKKTSNTYKENYERATEEALLLQEAMQNARESRKSFDDENRKMAEELTPKTTTEKIIEASISPLRYAKNIWLSQSTNRKVFLAATLASGGTVFAIPALGTIGLRVARGVVGATVGTAVGTGLGNIFDRKNQANEDLNTKEYAGNINPENFSEWEAKKLQEFENSQNTKRFQKAIKVGAAVVTGGAAAYGTGLYANSIIGHAPVEAIPNTGHLDILKAKPAVSSVPAGVLEAVEAKSELVSSDLVNEVHKLKSDILAQYHDGVVPNEIQQNILDVPTDKLLEKLHLLDPEHNSSAGNVGGHILFEKGKVVYEQGGISRDLYDPHIEVGFGAENNITAVPENINGTETLAGDPITTPMETTPTDPGFGVTEIHSQEPIVVDEGHLNIESTPKNIEVTPEVIAPLDSGKDSGFVDVGGQKTMMFNGHPVSHMEINQNGAIPVLDEKYQDGSQYENIRSAFAKEFNKVVEAKSMGTGKFSPFQESFKGGIISILHGTPTDPNHVSMVLNGKEMATGSVLNGVPKFTMHPELKGSFFTTTVYEEAFKVMSKKVKSGAFKFE